MLLSPAGKRCPLPDADLISTPGKIPSPPGAVKYAAVLSGVPERRQYAGGGRGGGPSVLQWRIANALAAERGGMEAIACLL
jgi:hypothetical protein